MLFSVQRRKYQVACYFINRVAIGYRNKRVFFWHNILINRNEDTYFVLFTRYYYLLNTLTLLNSTNHIERRTFFVLLVFWVGILLSFILVAIVYMGYC